ncbi:peptidylprolyl isomerase [Flavobacterium longum]|uniref:peptidylprolyl isomerase n=1 Tax=Flavobacterium longum TaxID=1299340 RepID=UPI0039EBBB91
MKLKLIVLMLLAVTTAFPQAKKKAPAAKPKTTAAKKVVKKAPATTEGIFATIETSKGNITVELTYKATPVTVANFISLAEGTNTLVGEQFKGKHFFDGLKFHRVIANFMIQGGDPQGNGSGGPGYAFKDEITDAKFDKAGILAMANSGPATNGSQFFITHKDTPWLNGKHTIFGYVTKGQDVVNAIAQDDVINKITISRNGADAKAFDAAKVFADDYKLMGDVKALAKKQREEMKAKEKAEYKEKYGATMMDKTTQLANVRQTATKTESGLEYKIVKAGSGKKPADGTTVYIHYAGFLEDGSLFDSSYADVSKAFGKYDENRDKQGGYRPFPFTAGKKDGLIPGFIEAMEKMNIGDKLVAFIPVNLAWGERGSGDVIPPNSNVIFEIELLDEMPK